MQPREAETQAPHRTPNQPRNRTKKATKEQTKTKSSSDLSRLGRELADRHGLQVSGFDTPDLDLAAAREFAAAIYAILPAYPEIGLRPVQIGPAATRLVELTKPDTLGEIGLVNSALRLPRQLRRCPAPLLPRPCAVPAGR